MKFKGKIILMSLYWYMYIEIPIRNPQRDSLRLID